MGRNRQEREKTREMAINGLTKLLMTLNNRRFILMQKVGNTNHLTEEVKSKQETSKDEFKIRKSNAKQIADNPLPEQGIQRSTIRIEESSTQQILAPQPRYGPIHIPLFRTNMKHAVIAYYMYFNNH